MSEQKRRVRETVANHRATILDVSHGVHSHAELAFDEHRSSELVASTLERNGFAVERGVADLETAFVARAGSGALHIGICAEYDALPNIGHACGHNIISASAVGAALALQPLADELDITVTVLGTPAEEMGGGKVYMLQKGAFDGLNAAMMVHPASAERDVMGSLAISQLELDYFGVSSHAAAAPHKGISASAALTQAQNGIALLREHFEEGDRVHGIVIKGGDATNIVPGHSKGSWLVRARDTRRLRELEARVIDVFRGAALATGCSFELRKGGPDYADIRSDQDMARLWRDNAALAGRTSLPRQPEDGLASTDMGNVSYGIPSIHPLIAIAADGANIHESQFERFARMQTGDDAALDGAAIMAMTAVDMATDTRIRSRLLARAYSQEAAGDAPYLARDWQRTITFDPRTQVIRDVSAPTRGLTD